MSRFRNRTVVQESLRNMMAHIVLTLTRVGIAALVGGLLALAVVSDTRGIVSRFAEQVNDGFYIVRVGGSGESPTLGASRCDAAVNVQGVVGSGAVLSVRSIAPNNQPLARYEVWTVTPGFVSVIWPSFVPDPTSPGALVGADAAEELGLNEGSRLAFRDAEQGSLQQDELLTIGQRMDLSPRSEGADRRIFVLSPPVGTTNECLVEARPGSIDEVGVVLRTWFTGQSATVIAPFVDERLGRSAEVEWRDRYSKYAGFGAGLAVGVVTILVWWTRRQDVAFYRLLGMSTAKLLLSWMIDSFIIGVWPVVVGFSCYLAVVGTVGPKVLGLAVWGLVQACLVLTMVPLFVAIVVPRRSTLNSLKGS